MQSLISFNFSTLDKMLIRNYLTLGLNKFFSRCASICLMKICLDRWTRNVQNLAVAPQILISTLLIYKQSQTEFLLTKISSGFDKGSAKRSSLSSSKSTTCSCLMPKKKSIHTHGNIKSLILRALG